MYNIIFIILVLIILFFSIRYPWWLPSKKGLLSLMYHHIDIEKTPIKQNSLFVSPKKFEKQIDILLSNGFSIISLDELFQAYQENTLLPKKTALITIDDGYLNNYTKAFPILKKKNVKANIFLTYNNINNNKDYMTWAQILEMENSGLVCFGSHTLNHTNLKNLSDKEILKELSESKIKLEKKLSKSVYCFAYPFGAGAFDDRIRNLIFKAGYLFDFSTKRGIDKRNLDNTKSLCRIFVKGEQSLFDFYLQITKGKSSF